MDMAPDPALKAGGPGTMPPRQVERRSALADVERRSALADVERWSALADVERWSALADEAAEANCFYMPELMLPALAHLAAEGEVRLIEVEEGGALIGLLPLAVARRHGRLPLPNLTNWMHRHCFLGAPLVRRGHERAAWAGFLERIDALPRSSHFLHLSGLDAAGANAAALEAVCAGQARPFVEIQRHDRALLRSDLSADAYWETHVRAKKRKEIRRLQKRLADLGRVAGRTLADAGELMSWCDGFLALEASGWKGAAGTALSRSPDDEAFFREAVAAAFAAGRLHFLRIDLDGRAIAMLVNFRHGRGAFSFKIAFDEALGRFSPGVLIEIDNLRAVQGDPGIDWMDSCAAADHPMIDSLWAERRSIVQFRVALKGSGLLRARRSAAFAAAGAAERLATFIKGS